MSYTRAITMDDDEILRQAEVSHQERLATVAKRLKDIGDDFERKTIESNHTHHASWLCLITAILTISACCLPPINLGISNLQLS